jgi:cytochrome c
MFAVVHCNRPQSYGLGRGKTLNLKALVIAVSIVAAPTQASSVETDEADGFQFAKLHCAQCHRINRGDTTIGFFEAPAFQTIADDPAVTATSLRVYLRTPHARMPDFILTDEQAQDIINYILSLK